MKNKSFILILFIGLWTLTACISSKEDHAADIEQLNAQMYAAFASYGYTGRFTIDETNYANEGVHYTYTESIDGKELSFQYYATLSDIKERTRLSSDALFYSGGDGYIKQTAMWRQPYVEEKLQSYEKAFQAKQNQFTVLGIEGETALYDNRLITSEQKSNALAVLIEDVQQNQSLKLPVNGYYSIDVPKHLSSGALGIHIAFNTDRSIRSLSFEEENRLFVTFRRFIKDFDYSTFWDGYYSIALSFHQGKTLGTFDMLIQNGKCVTLKEIRYE